MDIFETYFQNTTPSFINHPELLKKNFGKFYINYYVCKKPMKLYTEEQIRKAMNDYANTSSDLDNVMDVEMAIIEQLTPIELPSDEEIENYASKYAADGAIINGAKWMREQILNQNK